MIKIFSGKYLYAFFMTTLFYCYSDSSKATESMTCNKFKNLFIQEVDKLKKSSYFIDGHIVSDSQHPAHMVTIRIVEKSKEKTKTGKEKIIYSVSQMRRFTGKTSQYLMMKEYSS